MLVVALIVVTWGVLFLKKRIFLFTCRSYWEKFISYTSLFDSLKWGVLHDYRKVQDPVSLDDESMHFLERREPITQCIQIHIFKSMHVKKLLLPHNAYSIKKWVYFPRIQIHYGIFPWHMQNISNIWIQMVSFLWRAFRSILHTMYPPTIAPVASTARPGTFPTLPSWRWRSLFSWTCMQDLHISQRVALGVSVRKSWSSKNRRKWTLRHPKHWEEVDGGVLLL